MQPLLNSNHHVIPRSDSILFDSQDLQEDIRLPDVPLNADVLADNDSNILSRVIQQTTQNLQPSHWHSTARNHAFPDDYGGPPIFGEIEQNDQVIGDSVISSEPAWNSDNSGFVLDSSTPLQHSANAIIPISSRRGSDFSAIYPSLGSPDLEMFITRHDAFSVKPVKRVSAKLNHNQALRELQSYPEMMIKGSLPPFIHRHCSATGGRDSIGGKGRTSPPLPEPMAICASIMQMYFTRSNESSAFIRRTICAEVQRLHREYHSCTEWELLAAMQAIVIYILIRASEAKSSSPLDSDYDHQLIFATGEIAAKLYNSGYICEREVKGKVPEWQDWVLMESKRRTLSVMFIIDILVDIRVTQPPCRSAGFGHFPLPSKKGLWEAQSQSEWFNEYSNHLSSRKTTAMLLYEHLLQSSIDSLKDVSLGDLQSWSEDLDTFGMLILMLASVA